MYCTCRHVYIDRILTVKDTILQLYVIFENGVPLLQHNLLPVRSRLGGYQFLQIPYGVVRIALDSNLLTKTVVACYL